VHQLTHASGWIPNQPMDIETSNNVPTDPEALPADGDLHVDAANNMYHKFTDLEMVLKDHDSESWDDVESEASEGGSNHDNDSEDDFGDIYE